MLKRSNVSLPNRGKRHVCSKTEKNRSGRDRQIDRQTDKYKCPLEISVFIRNVLKNCVPGLRSKVLLTGEL